MSEMWENFDELFRALHRQDRRVTELENRLAQVEKDLHSRAETVGSQRVASFPRRESPLEKAA
jgi:hypothetical protein